MGLFSKKETMELAVPGMNCGHCEGKVKSALATVPGIDRFSVDLSAKKVQVTLSKKQPADFSQINEALTKAGYPGEQV